MLVSVAFSNQSTIVHEMFRIIEVSISIWICIKKTKSEKTKMNSRKTYFEYVLCMRATVFIWICMALIFVDTIFGIRIDCVVSVFISIPLWCIPICAHNVVAQMYSTLFECCGSPARDDGKWCAYARNETILLNSNESRDKRMLV